MSKVIRVIIDSDAGADDLFALMLAYLSPSLLIEKIVCSYGNFYLDDSFKKIKYFLGDIVNITRGEGKPLNYDFTPPVVSIHSDKSEVIALPNDIKSLKKEVGSEAELVYVCLGPLTNLAKLIENGLDKEIDKIFIMGGALFHPGNANYLAEANFFWDPDAVEIVFSSQKPIFLVPLNITDYVPLEIDKITNKNASKFIEKLFVKYNDYYKHEKKFFLSPKNNFEKEYYHAGCLHDPIVITSLINQHIITFKKIFISTQNIHNPRGFVHPLSRGEQSLNNCFELNVATNFNNDLFWKTIDQVLSR